MPKSILPTDKEELLAFYEAKRLKILERAKKWQTDNRDKVNARQKRYRDEKKAQKNLEDKTEEHMQELLLSLV
jgi:predicted ATP-binding protein involved in virulence